MKIWFLNHETKQLQLFGPQEFASQILQHGYGLFLWSGWADGFDSRAAYKESGERVVVSTVVTPKFLHTGDPEPWLEPKDLFETKVFGGVMDLWSVRSNTYDEATKIHNMAVYNSVPKNRRLVGTL